MDRSLRDLGQILVVMGALLGAVLGVGLALIVENADTSGTVVASGLNARRAGQPQQPTAGLPGGQFRGLGGRQRRRRTPA